MRNLCCTRVAPTDGRRSLIDQTDGASIQTAQVESFSRLHYRVGSLPCDARAAITFPRTGQLDRDNGRRKLKFRPIHAKTGELRTKLCDLRPATCVSVHRHERQFYWQFVPHDRIYRVCPFLSLSLSLCALPFSFCIFRVVHTNLYFSISTVRLPFGAISSANVLRIPRALL